MTKKRRRHIPTSSSKDRHSTKQWLSKRTAISVVIVAGVLFAALTTWQLAPSQGLGPALLAGAGFAVGIWIAFLLVLAFNLWIRRR